MWKPFHKKDKLKKKKKFNQTKLLILVFVKKTEERLNISISSMVSVIKKRNEKPQLKINLQEKWWISYQSFIKQSLREHQCFVKKNTLLYKWRVTENDVNSPLEHVFYPNKAKLNWTKEY